MFMHPVSLVTLGLCVECYVLVILYALFREG